jgi:CBS domain-containing protein
MHIHLPHRSTSSTSASNDTSPGSAKDTFRGLAKETSLGSAKPPSPRHPAKRPRVTFRPSAALGWLFVTFVLGTGPLQYAVPDQSGSAYFSAAALGGLAVMGSLLLAELRRARRMIMAGVTVDRVELGLLRARAITSGEVSTPVNLRRISWAGPLTLAAVAIGLAALGGVLSIATSASLSLLGATALFTGIGVASLAITELIPAPGSPGSQLIFAREWRRSGQRDAALVATAKAGLISGWFLVAAGAAVVIFLSLAGIWLAFIGAAVIAGSRLTLAGARTRTRLAGLRATDVMSAAPPEVSSFATAAVAFTDVAMPTRAPMLIVREPDGSFGGIVSARALAAVPGDDRELTRVRRLAVAPGDLPTVTTAEPIERVLELMAQHPLAGIAIVRSEDAPEQIAGVITPADIAHTLDLLTAANPGKRT